MRILSDISIFGLFPDVDVIVEGLLDCFSFQFTNSEEYEKFRNKIEDETIVECQKSCHHFFDEVNNVLGTDFKISDCQPNGEFYLSFSEGDNYILLGHCLKKLLTLQKIVNSMQSYDGYMSNIDPTLDGFEKSLANLEDYFDEFEKNDDKIYDANPKDYSKKRDKERDFYAYLSIAFKTLFIELNCFERFLNDIEKNHSHIYFNLIWDFDSKPIGHFDGYAVIDRVEEYVRQNLTYIDPEEDMGEWE